MSDTPTRCGVVAILGAPNAGKSTLVNALVGAKVAIVSPKAQTTRTRLMAIATQEQTQLLLLDTPGVFDPKRRLDRAMVKAAWDGAGGADVALVLMDATRKLSDNGRRVIEGVRISNMPRYLVLTKVDLVRDKERLLLLAQELHAELGFDETFMVSALTGDGMATLRKSLENNAPQGPWHYPEDQLVDATQRLLASELTREQLYLQLSDELPYAAAVETESWTEKSDGSAEVRQVIYVERDSQKPIVLGAKGARIKRIGAAARRSLEELLGRRAHLFLYVKVNPRWSEDRSLYRDMGLEWTE